MISCEKDNFSIHGEGPIATKNLSLSPFSGLDLSVAGNLVISQGPVQEVKVTGHSNIIDRITDRVSGDVWTIDLGNGSYRNYELNIEVIVPNLEEIALSGSGHIHVNDFTGQYNLDVDLSGSGQIDLHSFYGTENMDIDIKGSGRIKAYKSFPSLRNLDINISGSGGYQGFPVMSDVCDIKISGSGICQVSVRNTLDVTISGSGTVHYKGNPTVTSHTNTAGGIFNAN